MVPAGSNSALTSAVKNAVPGETIVLEGGTYTTGISTSVSGTAAAPITIEGENGATLSNATGTGEGVEVNNNYYIFQNFTISGFQESFRTDAASFGVANNITATGSKIESFKFKNTSQHWLVENCSVSNSGMEGYYVGDANQNWTGGVPDQSGYITFYHDTNNVNVNDGFDCKEGTSNVRIIDCESNWNNTTPGANDEGDSGAYVRNDNETVVDYTILNNQSQGNAVRAETSTVNGITYGSNCTIFGVVANNIQGSYLESTQAGTTLYTNYSLTNVAGGLLESGSRTPAEPSPSAFALPTWAGTDGEFLPINMTWDNSQSAVGDGATWDFNQQNFDDIGVNGDIPVIFFQGVGTTFNDSNNGHYNVTLGTAVNPASVTVNNSAGNYVFSGSGGIAGTATLAKSGSGTLTLATANSYTGATTVTAGTVAVTNVGAFGTTPGTSGTSSVTVASGAALSLATGSAVLSYTGTINLTGSGVGGTGAMIFSSRSVLDATSTGTFATTNIAGGTSIAVNSGTLAASNSIGPISGSGGLTFISNGSGVLAMNSVSTSAPVNSYTGLTTVGSGVTLILHNSSFADPAIPGDLTINNGGTVGLANNNQIGNTSLVTDNGTLDLNIRGAATGFTAAVITDTVGALAGSGSVTTSGAPASGTNSSTLTLGLSDGSSHTFTGNISELAGNQVSLVKAGNFTQVLDGVDSYTGSTIVSNGTLEIGASGGLGDGAVSVTGGKLQLAANTGLAQITSLATSGNGTFDVNNNHVIITYGSGPDPIASIAAMIATGFNTGHWNGAGGIISTAAASNGASYGLGYADGDDPQAAATGLASGMIEIKYTLLGDADLNGIVNGIDFGILAANFNKGITGWDEGDFNYDNIVNGLDFGDLAANFNKGASGADAFAALESFAAANGLMADVPEPVSGGLLVVAMGMIAARRRKLAF